MKKLILQLFAATLFMLCVNQVIGQATPELLYYKFDGAGTSVPNLATAPPSGTNTAVIMGALTEGPSGQCGGALIGSGNSSSTDYLNTGYMTNLSGTSWTISIWTSNITPNSTLFYIFGDATATSFRCFTNGVAGANNWILRGGFTDVLVNGGATVAPHVTTFVYDMSLGYIYAYLDGVLVNAVAQGVVTIAGTGPLKVMGYATNVGAPAGGLLDEFRLYNRALSAAEVMELTYVHTDSYINPTVCSSMTSPSGLYTWTTSGVYNDTIPNMTGCDSVITVDLTVNYPSSSIINPVVCDSYTSPSGLYTWNTSGYYNDTIPNMAGCDSVITVDLTVNHSSASTINPVVCESYTSPSGIYTWNTSGSYNDTIPNMAGCDSVITVDLTVNYPSASTINPVVCNSFTSPSGLYTWNTSGSFNDTIPNMSGCDSVITIDLTVNYSSASTINPLVCNSLTSPSGLYTWITSGTYNDTIPNVAGCDSLITVNLTVIYSTASTINPVVCNSYTSPSGLHTWTSSGTYNDTIPNMAGCDSVITVDLTVNYPTASTINPVVCNSYTSPSGLHTWTTSGTYYDTIPNMAGCDSVISVDLTVNYSSASTINPVVCNSYTSPSGLHTWTTSGTYSDTIPNVAGCDSLITIQLTVNTIDNSVTQANETLTSNETGAATYQWLDCDNGFSLIPGETYQSFTATTNGNYAVAIINGACNDTSDCIQISSIGIGTIASEEISVYPNPATNNLTIENMQEAVLELFTMQGQSVMLVNVPQGKTVINIAGLTTGVYILRLKSNDLPTIIKIVKE